MGETGFAAATAVEALGDGAYRADIDATWGVFGNANGGYLLAIMARAALHAGERAFPHAVSASYLRPGAGGPARIDVEILRAGNTATQARVVLSQEQGPAIDATFVLGDLPSGDLERAASVTLPPAPELCATIDEHPPGIDILERIGLRYAPGLDPREPGEPRIHAWFELLSPEPPDPLHALLACDALAPSVHRLGNIRWAPTVQLTAYLHAVPAPGPLAVDAEAGEVRDGWFDESMVVVDSTGRLVVRARQLARLPRWHDVRLCESICGHAGMTHRHVWTIAGSTGRSRAVHRSRIARVNHALRHAAAGVALAVAGTLALQTPAEAAVSLSSARTKVDSLTDAARKKAGCKPLTVSTRLNTSAQRHAKDMATNNYLSHTSPDGTTWIDRIKAAGHPSPGAENLARGYDSATVVVKKWLESPAHRRNVVNCQFTKVGIGYANPGNYWVQDFGY